MFETARKRMLGGLYGDLPEAKSTGAKSSTDSGRWVQKPAFAPPIRKHVPVSGPKAAAAGSKTRNQSGIGCVCVSILVALEKSKDGVDDTWEDNLLMESSAS